MTNERRELTAEELAYMEEQRERNAAEFSRLMNLGQKREDLLPELVPYWRYAGTPREGLYHPLFHTTVNFSAGHYANVNDEFRGRKRRLEEARAKNDLPGAVFAYHSRYQMRVLAQEAESSFGDDQAYWGILAGMWLNEPQPWTERALFLKLLRSPRAQREALMEPAEQEFLRALPDVLRVYRGFAGLRGEGLSWTLDRDKAIWFANRFAAGKPLRIFSGTCRKADLFAYFNSRHDDEIVIDPKLVTRRRISTIR